jgi:hypothetical protein
MTTDDLGASVRLEHRVHCLLELTSPKAPAAERRPLHLALVIDRSGSMAGDKLETTKACAAYLERRFAPSDRLAVVTYDDEVRLELPLTEVGHDQLPLNQALPRIQPGGMTNLSGGWLKGVEQLRAVPGGIGPKKVLLLTDGLANQGVTDLAALVRMARGACDEGVATTTIGFDEELLTGIADVGASNAYFAGTPEETPGILAQEFEGLTALVAQNLPISEMAVRHVFAFGAECFRVLDGLSLRREVALGMGGEPYPTGVASRTVGVSRHAGDSLIVAERHAGAAGPPSAPETERLREALDARCLGT